MTLPRNSEMKILPLHTQTPLAQILRTWPMKPLKCVILLIADCLNLLLVFPEDEDTYRHEESVLICCCVCDLSTSLVTCMEVATYTETGCIVVVINCELCGSGLYNVPPSHLRSDCTGLVQARKYSGSKLSRWVLRTANSLLIKVHRKLLDLEYGPLKHIY